MSHSPAPWSIELDFDMQGMDKVHYHIRDANSQTVCDLDIDMHKPNVRLIAVAPMLLKALKELVYAYEQVLYDELNRYPDELPIAVTAREAIAKAEVAQ